jgi:hypothetical protein
MLNHLSYTAVRKPSTAEGGVAASLEATHRNQDKVNQSSVWQSLYSDALVELDPIKLLQKIDVAQEAIGDRLNGALHGRNPIDSDERQAIEDARHNLRFLKKHPA